MVWMLCISGCTHPAAPEDKESLEGLTLGKLKPINQPEWKVDAVISVLVYELPKDKMGQVPGQLTFLDSKSLDYYSKDGFAANGLWAAKGKV